MPDTLRVAMIIQRYYPLVGGAERIVGSLAPKLQANGVEVFILTRRYPGLLPYERIEGVPVFRLPIPGPKITASLSFTLNALPLILRLRPHVLHAHELFSPATTAVMAQKMIHAPIIVTPHRSGPLGDVQRLQRKFLGKQRLNAIARKASAFITISSEIDQELSAVGISLEKRITIPNGVDTQRFHPLVSQAKAILRAQLELPAGPLAIFMGRLSPEKRADQLISLWPKVTHAIQDATLLLLGTGELETTLKRNASPGVKLVGAVQDVVPYLQSADLFVLPSVAEGLSVAMLEAMSCGLPVLITRVGGAPEVITHGKNGWLIPPDDQEQLYDGVITLLTDPEFSARMGKLGRERICTDYSLDTITTRLINLYQKVRGTE